MFIAELCQNHRGDLKLLREMVERAAAAGATYAKIQTFFAEDLSSNFMKDKLRLEVNELDWEAHKKFVIWCRELKIEPMTSVYTAKYLLMLKKLGFKFIKIGSAQAKDAALAQSYIKAGFNVIVSTGGHSLYEIPRLNYFSVMHCVSLYPTPHNKLGLGRIPQIERTFNPTGTVVRAGFSDHSDPTVKDWFMPSLLARSLGAGLIEKHFTILPRNETKDGPVSIDYEQMVKLISWLYMNPEDLVEKFPGMGEIAYVRNDIDIIKKYKGRWNA